MLFRSPYVFGAPLSRIPSEFRHNILYGKTRMVGYQKMKRMDMFSCSHTIHECDGLLHDGLGHTYA